MLHRHTELIRPGIRNLVFDLGGVILNLSFNRTYEAFSKLSGLSKAEIEKFTKGQKFFLDYETGAISSDEFRKSIRAMLTLTCTDDAIDETWNAMLLDMPVERLRTLLRLKDFYRVFLLSNTNEIHMHAFNKIVFQCWGSKNLDEFFEKVYLSQQVGLRKPNTDIYSFVLDQNNLVAHETLFFDDTEPNLAGAQAVGMNTFHVKNANELFEELDKIK